MVVCMTEAIHMHHLVCMFFNHSLVEIFSERLVEMR